MKQIAILLTIFFLSCDKVDYVPDNPYAGMPTQVLMHRGNGWNTDYEENTFDGAMYGFSVFDGVELDIQISKNGTLWLDHGNEVKDCSGNEVGCFNTMLDEEILSYNVCGDHEQYHTLESVFQEMATQYPAKYISLDIKGQYCQISLTADDMERMAEAVISLTKKYHLEGHVIAESNSINFLEKISDENAPVCQALVVLDDLDQGLSDAYKLKARAISYKLEAEEKLTEGSVELVHKKGFGMIVWTVNEPIDISEVWSMHPDFIETDNPDFRNYIPDN